MTKKRAPERRAKPKLPPKAVSAPALEIAGVDRLWTAVALGCVGLFALVYGYREIFSPDIGFHLATGRDIVAAHAVPRFDTLTWTRSDQANTNLWWLYQTLLWLGWRAGGGFALVAGHLLVTFGVLALALQRARERVGHLPAVCAGLMLLFALANTWETRPHVASWLYLSLVLWLLERDAEGRAGRAIWLLPLIQMLWINTHALFVLGFVAIGAHVVDRLLDPSRRRDPRLLAVAAVSLVACLVNPFHVHGLLLSIEQFGILRGSLFVSPDVGIAEYRALFDFSGFRSGEQIVWFQPSLFALIYLGVAVVGAAAGWRRLRWSERILFAAFGYLFVTATRNFGFFFLVTFPGVALGLAQLGVRRRHLTARLQAVVAALSLALAALAFQGRLFAWQWSADHLGSAFNASTLPVEACRFLVEHRIEGRVLNSWDDGGYVAFATGLKTFIDGRMEVMKEPFFREYLKLKDPETIAAALAHFAPDVAIVPHVRIPFWLFELSQRQRWRMVYADESWALFLRPGLRPDLPEAAVAHPVAGVQYPAFTGEEARAVMDAEAGKPSPGLAEAWRGRDGFPTAAVRWSGFYFQSGHPEAAAGVALAVLRDSRVAVPDLELNLGHSLLRAGDAANADRAFELFTRHSGVSADIAAVRDLRASLRRRE